MPRSGTYGQITEAFCAMEEAFIAAADGIAEELYREGCPAFANFFYYQSWKPNTPEGLAQLRVAHAGPPAGGQTEEAS